MNGQTVTVQILNSSNTVVDSYTTTASGGTWSVDVTKAQAQGLTDGSYTVTANVSDVAGNPAPQATRALTVDETGPGIAINAIASDNIINASEAADAGGVIISGTATDGSGTGVNGHPVTVQIFLIAPILSSTATRRPHLAALGRWTSPRPRPKG